MKDSTLSVSQERQRIATVARGASAEAPCNGLLSSCCGFPYSSGQTQAPDLLGFGRGKFTAHSFPMRGVGKQALQQGDTLFRASDHVVQVLRPVTAPVWQLAQENSELQRQGLIGGCRSYKCPYCVEILAHGTFTSRRLQTHDRHGEFPPPSWLRGRRQDERPKDGVRLRSML